MNNQESQRMLVTATIDELVNAIATKLEEKLITGNKEKSKMDDLVPFLEVCKMFDVSKTSIHKWRRLGILPNSIKIGGRVYFRKEQLKDLIKDRSNK